MKYVRDYKNCNTLVVKAFFKIVNRAIMLELDLKDKTNKSRPDIIRVIPLFDIDPPSDNPFNDFVPDIARLLTSKTVI